MNLSHLGVQLVSSGMNGVRSRMKPFWCHAIFFLTLFSCSCLLSFHSTVQSSNISEVTCFWHFWFKEWGALIVLFTSFRTPLLTLHFFSPLCSSFLSLPCICLLLFSIYSFCFGSSFFYWLSWLYIAFHLPTNCNPYPYLLTLLSLFEWFNCIITSFLGANHCCYFSWILVFLWQFLDLIMLCFSGATLLFDFVSLFSPFSIVFYSEFFINMYALFVIHLINT